MAKPAFDPSKPFEPVAQAKPAFDPSKPFEPAEAEPNPDESFGQKVGGAVISGLRAIDSVTGAPSRSAVGALQDGKGLMGAVEAFQSQFAEDPAKAPLGIDLARKAGVSSDPIVAMDPETLKRSQMHADNPVSRNPFGGIAKLLSAPRDEAVGVAADIGTDWTNALPLVGPAKKIAQTAGSAAKGTRLGQATAQLGQATVRGAEELASAAKAKMAGMVPDKVAQAAHAVGTAKDIGVQAVKNTVDSLGKTISPKVAADYERFKQIAVKHGIDPADLPEAVEFGHDSEVTWRARLRNEGEGGEQYRQKFSKVQGQVQEGITGNIQKIARGAPIDEVSAGRAIRQGFDDALGRIIDKDSITYHKVQKYAPGLYINKTQRPKIESAINGLEKWAKGEMRRGFTAAERERGAQVLMAVQAARQTKGSFKQTVELMQRVGKVAFSKVQEGADITPDKARFKDFYHTLKDAVIETVSLDVNPQFAIELKENNKLMSKLFNDQSVVNQVVSNPRVADEKVFQALIKNGDTAKVEALKGVLSPEQMQQLKGAFLETLVKREADGSINVNAMRNALRNKRTMANSLFDPGELQDIEELAELADRFGEMKLSSSGTGASFARSKVEALKQGVTNAALVEAMKQRARNAPQMSAPSTPMGRPRPGLSLPRSARTPQKISQPSKLYLIEERKRGGEK